MVFFCWTWGYLYCSQHLYSANKNIQNQSQKIIEFFREEIILKILRKEWHRVTARSASSRQWWIFPKTHYWLSQIHFSRINLENFLAFPSERKGIFDQIFFTAYGRIACLIVRLYLYNHTTKCPFLHYQLALSTNIKKKLRRS